MVPLIEAPGKLVSTTRITNADSPYTILPIDEILYCDTDAGAITVNLPAGTDGRKHRIINAGTNSNNLVITPNGAELLIGENSSFTLFDQEALNITYETTEGWS